VLGAVAARMAHLDGINNEETYQLALLTGRLSEGGLRGIFLAGVILAGLGVLNDVTITQASAVWELGEADATASRRSLFSRAMRIGRDHIASTVYTMAFAYAGAALPVMLLLQVHQRPLISTITSGEFAEEIARTAVGSIGLVLTIPLTTFIAVLVATARPVYWPRHRDGPAPTRTPPCLVLSPWRRRSTTPSPRRQHLRSVRHLPRRGPRCEPWGETRRPASACPSLRRDGESSSQCRLLSSGGPAPGGHPCCTALHGPVHGTGAHSPSPGRPVRSRAATDSGLVTGVVHDRRAAAPRLTAPPRHSTSTTGVHPQQEKAGRVRAYRERRCPAGRATDRRTR